MAQLYGLGQKVWAFKQAGSKEKLQKKQGIVQSIELDDSGFLFYKIAVTVTTPEGVKVSSIMANNASVALTEEDIDRKIESYHNFQEEQKKVFEERFGGPDFEQNYINEELAKLIKE